MSEVTDWVRARGGVVRVREARDAGYGDHAIRSAVRGGELTRPRGGWIAAADADVELVAAARAGVVLTCISLASRMKLWVEKIDKYHVAAPASSGGVTANGAHIHWSKPVVPRVPGLLVDGVENMLALIASCQPHERALAIWESALKHGVADLQQLRRLPLTGAALELARIATPFADSGLETYVITRLRWLGLPIVPQVWIAGHRVDFLIGERLVLQIDGAHHVGKQRAEDIAHDALLLTLGYHVIRVGYLQVIDHWPVVQQRILVAVAQGLHRAR